MIERGEEVFADVYNNEENINEIYRNDIFTKASQKVKIKQIKLRKAEKKESPEKIRRIKIYRHNPNATSKTPFHINELLKQENNEVIKRKGNFATNRIKYSTISEDNARLYKIKKILNEDTHYRQNLPKVVNIKGYRRNDNHFNVISFLYSKVSSNSSMNSSQERSGSFNQTFDGLRGFRSTCSGNSRRNVFGGGLQFKNVILNKVLERNKGRNNTPVNLRYKLLKKGNV